MPLKCIAIDDEPLALELLRNYTSRIADLQLVETFTDAISGAEFLRERQIDLLFLDVNMPDISGLDLVRSLEVRPMIIFTTAHRKFAVEGFELNAVDYLLKPIDFSRFKQAVEKAIDFFEYKTKREEQNSGHLFVYSEYRLVKIPFNQILYIESLEDYSRIHLANEKPIMTLMPLKKVMEKLPEEKFRRIHRSYIISLSQVKSVSVKKAVLRNAAEVPVGSSYSAFAEEWKSKHK